MRNHLLNIWHALDPIYYNFTRLHHVTDTHRNKTLFRVRLTRYKGSTIIMRDGTIVHKNDLLLKIHLHNVRMICELRKLKSEMRRASLVYHMIRDDLFSLSSYVRGHQRCHDIKAVIGITTLHKGTGRLGFETFEIHNRYYRLFKQSTFLPINFIADTLNHQAPIYLFMSKEHLLDKYPQ